MTPRHDARTPARQDATGPGEPRRRTRRGIVIGSAMAALVAAGLLVGLLAGTAPDSAPVAEVPSDGPARLSGTDPVSGQRVDIADYAGKPVVVNIWASWCPGCNQEATDLARFAAAHPEAQVLGLDTEDAPVDARAFYHRWSWHHPSIGDPNGSLAHAFGLQGLPTTIFLDAAHRPVAQIVGKGDRQAFERGLALAAGRGQ